MITVYKQRKVIGTDRYDYHIKGLSTDEKPLKIYGIDIVENSIMLECDTGDFYYLKQHDGGSTTEIVQLVEQLIFEYWSHHTAYKHGIPAFTQKNVIVVWDGVEYECEGITTIEGNNYNTVYGSQDNTYTDYPFHIESVFMEYGEPQNDLVVQTPTDGTHTLEIHCINTITSQNWVKIGSGGSPSPEPTGELLFDGDVTTQDNVGVDFAHAVLSDVNLNYDSITVEFNGLRYVVKSHIDDYSAFNRFDFGAVNDGMGGIDFSLYPFMIDYGLEPDVGVITVLFTESSDTYSLKIWANSDPVVSN